MSKFRSFKAFFLGNKYTVFVLVMFMLTYLTDQLNTYSLIATNISMAQELEYGDRVCDVLEENVTALQDYLRDKGINQTASDYCDSNEQLCGNDVASNMTWCYWRYTGTGTEYQLLAGPLYMFMFAFSAIPMGFISELSNINRKLVLATCCTGWALMTLVSGFSTQYWHVCLARLFSGVFSAGCVPFSASMISDYYTTEQRGSAMGFFNWGIYLGYSLSFVLIAAERALGWRSVYFIAGSPGLVMAVVLLLTVKDPPRRVTAQALNAVSTRAKKLKEAARYFANPTLIMLCLGGAIRNGAGIVWAYNSVNFFDQYHPDVNVERWLSWIPLVFGSIGSLGGGYLSDLLSAKRGPTGRLIVLIGCLLLSAPFQVGLLLFSDPWCFISHMVGYVIGEMWIGVCIAVVLDIVPPDLTTSAVAVYFFTIQIVGGNMPLFVTPITNGLSLRAAMLICFPGFYLLGALFFAITFFMIKRKEAHVWELETIDVEETKETETKGAETKEAETKEAETKETDTKEAETKEAETKEAETKEADTKEAETKDDLSMNVMKDTSFESTADLTTNEVNA